MRGSRLVLCVIALGCALMTRAQTDYQNVRLDQQSGWGYPPCEPSIAVSQEDPAIIVAGAILDKVYTSSDSGKTWVTDKLVSDHGVFGDPCIVSSPTGDFYYLHLSDPSGKGWAHESLLDRIVCQRSTDNGKTWNKGASIGLNSPKDQDKEWAVLDPEGKHIYATWTQFDLYNDTSSTCETNILYSCANHKAEKWTEAVAINQYPGNCLDSDDTVEGAVPAVGTEGEIYVAWALADTIFFDRSLDNGNTWLEEDIYAGPIVGGWDQSIPGIDRANGMPVLMVDHSQGPHRGRLYINYADQRNGEEDTDIWLIWSDDKGDTWSEPRRVNDDEAGHQQFFTWMAIDQTNGNVYMVFYDRRDTEGLMTDVYLASTTDGGKTILNERISEESFDPRGVLFFGDYNNISAHGGVVRPIWTRADEGKLSVWTALIDK